MRRGFAESFTCVAVERDDTSDIVAILFPAIHFEFTQVRIIGLKCDNSKEFRAF